MPPPCCRSSPKCFLNLANEDVHEIVLPRLGAIHMSRLHWSGKALRMVAQVISETFRCQCSLCTDVDVKLVVEPAVEIAGPVAEPDREIGNPYFSPKLTGPWVHRKAVTVLQIMD